MEYSIRLLNSAYHKENVDGVERAIVYLYGTTKDGEAIAVRTPLLRPYFQVVEASKDIKKRLEKDDNVDSILSAIIILPASDTPPSITIETYFPDSFR